MVKNLAMLSPQLSCLGILFLSLKCFKGKKNLLKVVKCVCVCVCTHMGVEEAD